MGKKVLCSVCKKEIGEMVYEGGINAGSGIGFIPSYAEKVDYRKASHICINSKKEEFGRGRLCKACAKKAFPEGKAYKVRHWCDGRETSLYTHKGEGYGTLYISKDIANAVVERREKEYGDRHWIEEVEL